ncbi:MAG TPA: response regulator [Candidatus Dormibacteraeota bacterium]|jgi:putative two-component system response regulator
MSKVLVIDDEQVSVELITAYLEDHVDEIRGLTDPRQAEQVFTEFQPDVVVLDLHMPHMDGFEVLRTLRSARTSLGFLPVIVLTGDETHVARNTALILGADEFLMKPVDRQEIVLRVRNLLRTREVYVAAREGREA